MYHREFPLTPSQQAVNGSLDIYVEGRQKDSARQMLFGLSVLQEATEAQIQAAMQVVQVSRHLPANEISTLLAASDFSESVRPGSATTTEAESWRALSSPVRETTAAASTR